MNHLQIDYFEYMMSIVSPKNTSYGALFYYLYSREFIAINKMDENRIDDGINFRYRFGDMYGYSREEIAQFLDNRPCSVFEMMFALSFRCEEQIMYDASYGDRTSEWFWTMIANLGLGAMDDGKFDVNYVSSIVDRLISRQYEPNGKGGLFTVHGKSQDLRDVEIWYQLMWYLDENYPLNL